MKNCYCPEGYRINTKTNLEYLANLQSLERAVEEGAILEATALMCDEGLNLHFEIGGIKAIMPRSECIYYPTGGEVKDIAILTRVGKVVCFKVLDIEYRNGDCIAILSRRMAQKEFYQEFFDNLKCGDIIPARVTHLESFGAFIDIGCGVSSLLSVDSLSVSRISHPRDRVRCGMNIKVVIKSIDRDLRRIYATQKELLGTWEENARHFNAGQTVTGIVRSVENYGIFVELAPNLAGLAEMRAETELDASALIGKEVSVYIKSIIPERMKIKLVIIDLCKTEKTLTEPIYYVDTNAITHISRWRYSPTCAIKVVESIFDTDN